MYARLDKDAPDTQKIKKHPRNNTTIVTPKHDSRTKIAKRKAGRPPKEEVKVREIPETPTKDLTEFKRQFKEYQANNKTKLDASKLPGNKDNIIWQPQPGFQVNVLASSEFEVLAGGGRGSGKATAYLSILCDL